TDLVSAARTILVTGASSGIGAATVIAAAREGWRIVVTARDETRLHSTAATCAASGAADVTVVTVDLASPWEAAQALGDACDAASLRVNAIVNAAGVAAFQPIGETDPEFFEATMRVNALAPAAIIARFWGSLVAHGAGRIVNISSMASVDPYHNLFAYGASKAALDNLTRSCAGDGSALGVKAWSILPGVVETPMLRRLFTEAQVPSHRATPPGDMARVAIDLIADRRPESSGSLLEFRADP
ncbi:MAG: SDR family NAD(P)-dependent oxidoreductase, partial [Planctomycetota bacterium]|nr:SDR family NAD(P)-dependent oxidoreductase [Planctomycetota bacterium]